MAVTLQQIAEAAGVSRGTVDRALNNRGRINAQVAERIKRLAVEMGYQPNRAGRALAMSRKSITIGVILQAMETPFMETVLSGIEAAAEEVARMGGRVLIRKHQGWDAGDTVRMMHELRQVGCDGIAAVLSDDEELRDVVNEFVDGGLPVVTFNSDIEHTKRLCFIGYDTRQNGKVAAGLMAEIVPERGKVLMLAGHPGNHTHNEKADSFAEELLRCRSDIRLLSEYAFDNDKLAENLTREVLKKNDDLSGIYLVASGVHGVCKVLEEHGAIGKIKVISNDLTEENKEFLREGKIQFLLGQEGYHQGYEPVMLLFDKLFDGKEPEAELAYPEIVIKTKYNL